MIAQLVEGRRRVGKIDEDQPVELFGDSRFPPVGPRPYMLSLAPYGYYWFKLERHSGEGTYGIEETLI